MAELAQPVYEKNPHMIYVGDNMSPESEDFKEGFSLQPEQIRQYLCIGSPLSDELGRLVMTRTLTAGRTASAYLGGFKGPDGSLFSDIIIKGVGALNPLHTSIGAIRTLIDHSKGNTFEDAQIHNSKTSAGRELPIRYSVSTINGIMTKLGFSPPLEQSEIEENISKRLSQNGMRTRRLMYVGKFGPKMLFATDKGLLRTEEIKEKLGYTPGLEAWGVRCQYRVADMINIAPDVNTHNLSINDFILFNSTKGYWTDLRPTHVRIKESFEKDAELKPIKNIIVDNLRYLSYEILKRCTNDDDQRFVELALPFKNVEIADVSSQKTFWINYINVFSNVIGEQLGIMFAQGAFSKGRLLNLQNITLLSEIVDHDVTYFNSEELSDPNKVINQIDLVLNSITSISKILYSIGYLEHDTDLIKIFDSFVVGIVKKLDEKSLNIVKSTIRVRYEENGVSTPQGNQLYDQLLKDIQRLKDLETAESDIANKEKLLAILGSDFNVDIRKPLNPSRGKDLVLTSDLLGGSSIKYVLDKILETTKEINFNA